MTRVGNLKMNPSYSARFNAAVSRPSPLAAILRRKRRKMMRMSRAQKRIVLSLWKRNLKMAHLIEEKDQAIAWLSGCYCLDPYRDD